MLHGCAVKYISASSLDVPNLSKMLPSSMQNEKLETFVSEGISLITKFKFMNKWFCRYMVKLKSCVFNCLDQCKSHHFDFTVSKALNYPSSFYLIQELNLMRASGVNSPLVTQLLAKIESNKKRRD